MLISPDMTKFECGITLLLEVSWDHRLKIYSTQSDVFVISIEVILIFQF